MAFVVSDGQMMGLQRPAPARIGNISLASDYTADYATIWKTQPHVRTVIGFLARNIAQIGLEARCRDHVTVGGRQRDEPTTHARDVKGVGGSAPRDPAPRGCGVGVRRRPRPSAHR